MSFGSRLLQARKKKGMSQEELAKVLGTKGPAIGRYERDEMKPSIEVARSIADILNVSLDFLTGKVDEHIDKSIIDKVLTIQKLPQEERERILFTVDALIRDAKSRFAYAS